MAIGQSVAQLFIAEGARISPMEIIIGPVTTGGKNFITLFAPKPLIRAAKTRYKSPAQNTPPQAYGSISVLDDPSASIGATAV